MRYSLALLPTLKEVPQDAEVISHQLMLRAGLIRKLSSGTYTYLPIGLRVLHKAIKIVREEMNRIGAEELLLPAIHPADLWKESGRFEILGDDMIHFEDRHGKTNVLGPTHEEIITDLIRSEISSYKQLPLSVYQIQTKFRDEMRPRAGVIRSREFLMKDAYSFHESDECLDESYEMFKKAYEVIFKRCGLDYFIVQADPGAMGGSGSQEFVLFSKAGEDRVVQYGDSTLVKSAEIAERRLAGLKLPNLNRDAVTLEKVSTPDKSSIEAVSDYLKSSPKDLIKTMLFVDPSKEDGCIFAVLVRGDHDVSEYKVKKKMPNAFLASKEQVESIGSSFGFSGPANLKVGKIFVDEDVLSVPKSIIGANEKDQHFNNVSLENLFSGTDADIDLGDFREVVEGDKGFGEDGKEVSLKLHTAIELGHIFKLGQRYSKPMKAKFLNSSGKSEILTMGCYGIGVNRMIAAAIEQKSSSGKIFWPSFDIAPFHVVVLSTNMKNEGVASSSKELYQTLLDNKVEVLWDDREISAGIKFNDADLLGIPLRVVIGPKGIEKNEIEITNLFTDQKTTARLEDVYSTLKNFLP